MLTVAGISPRPKGSRCAPGHRATRCLVERERAAGHSQRAARTVDRPAQASNARERPVGLVVTERVISSRVSVPFPFVIPPPLLALPLAIVRPEIVTFRPFAVIANAALVPPPLIVSSLAPGPAICRLLLMSSAPLVSAIVWPSGWRNWMTCAVGGVDDRLAERACPAVVGVRDHAQQRTDLGICRGTYRDRDERRLDCAASVGIDALANPASCRVALVNSSSEIESGNQHEN